MEGNVQTEIPVLWGPGEGGAVRRGESVGNVDSGEVGGYLSASSRSWEKEKERRKKPPPAPGPGSTAFIASERHG